VDGLISVSDNYISDLKNRYPLIKHIPSATITFGAFGPDMQIAEQNKNAFPNLLDSKYTNVVYIGRGGADMHMAITPLFKALKTRLDEGNEALKSLRFYFIGTSYAANGQGKPSILPLALQLGVADSVVEITDRISYYHTLIILQQADALFISGSDDPKYTASKIYPYLLTQKPLLAIFNKASSAINIIKEYGVKQAYDYETVTEANISTFLSSLINGSPAPPQYHAEAINKYSARQMTINQCKLFDSVTGGKN
jgi:hypothetical protein